MITAANRQQARLGGAPPVLVGTRSAQFGAGGTVTIDYPDGTVAGDLIILVCGADVGSATFTATGFTTIYETSALSISGCHAGFYYKVAGAETSVTVSNSAGTTKGGCAIISYTSAAYGGSDGGGYTAPNSSPPNSGAVTAAVDDIVLAAVVVDEGPSITAIPSGYTERINVLLGSVSSGVTIGVADKAITSAGSEDPGAWTTAAPGGAICIYITILITGV